MKRKIFNLAICLLFSLSIAYSQTARVYTESSEVIANPDRGLQKYSITDNSYNTTTNYSNLSQSTLTGWRTGADKITVIFRYFLLDAYLNANISQTYLDNIQKDFNIIRDAGLKCIVRFSYSNGQSSSPQQPVKSQILTHINQISSLLEANKDVIVSHQAGFLGTWGEWYYTNSSEFGTDGSINSVQWANRKEIIDAMLSATPSAIPLQVRYPEIKKNMYGNSQLTASTAYGNTPAARIGFYNDAFLNVWGDMGTYSVSSENQSPIGTTDYNYLSNETKYTPMSGETNGLNPPRTDGANAVNEMDLTNWSILNRDYFTQNFTNWINSGHYPEILRNLGYRYVLKEGVYNKASDQLSIDITLQNVGFARLFKERKVFLILKNSTSNQEYSYLINTDPRTWEGEITISQNINISNLPQGTYDAYLSLPDSNAQLALRSEYSIRFANDNVWDASNGYNNLDYSFSVTTEPEPDCPEIEVIIDGNNTEWSSVAVYADQTNQVLKIYDNEQYVAFMFDGDQFVNYQFYIDTDEDTSTGYTGHSWSNIGADYMIENGILYKYTGSGTDWSWTSIGNVPSAVNNGIVEVQMDRDYFTEGTLMAGIRTLDASWSVVEALPSISMAPSYNFCKPLLEGSKFFQGYLENNHNGKELVIYPNPATDLVNVLWGENMDSELLINVFSSNGQLVLSKSVNNQQDRPVKLDLSSIDGGVYSIIVKSWSTVKTGRIVRIHHK